MLTNADVFVVTSICDTFFFFLLNCCYGTAFRLSIYSYFVFFFFSLFSHTFFFDLLTYRFYEIDIKISNLLMSLLANNVWSFDWDRKKDYEKQWTARENRGKNKNDFNRIKSRALKFNRVSKVIEFHVYYSVRLNCRSILVSIIIRVIIWYLVQLKSISKQLH